MLFHNRPVTAGDCRAVQATFAARATASNVRCVLQKEETALVMHKGDEAFEKAVLEGAGDVLNSALTNPMFGML